MIKDSFVMKAYSAAESILGLGDDPEIIVKTNVSPDHHHIKKSMLPISKASKFWSNASSLNPPVFFISVDENGRDFLYTQLEHLLFLDAMPGEDRWNASTNEAIFGSGGHSFIDGELVLLYWQVAGSKNKFDNTGTLKTAPHLFTHAMQSATFANSEQLLTDLPGWFIEGQADFVGIFSISESISEYLYHRSRFFSVAYVPGEHENKKKLKEYSVEDWYTSLYNSPEKFAGVKLIDEYYSGLMAYEFLLSNVGSENILNIYKEFSKGENFYDLIKTYSGYSKEEFCLLVAEELVKVSGGINA